MLKLLRKGPVCSGRPRHGSVCDARVDHLGALCLSCLEQLSTGGDVEGRLEAAGQAELPVELFELLAADPDDRVRLRIARHTDCPLIVLQRLEADPEPAVRLAAAATLSISLSPRVLRQPEQDEALFTREEVEALGRSGSNAVAAGASAPVAAERVRRVAAPGPVVPTAAIATVLTRLDELGERLSVLEGALSATGERLGAVAARLDELAGVGPGAVAAGADAAMAGHRPGRRSPAGSGTGLLPMPRPAALGTGPVVRGDLVAAAWLAVIPLLARRRGAGIRVSPPSAPTDRIAGPLLPPRPPIAGELPAASGLSVRWGGTWATAGPDGLA
jgi:hypothetical protein